MENFLRLVLVLAWMVVLVRSIEVGDFNKNRRFNVTQDIPSYFQRLYEEWSEDDTCTNQTVKCSQAEVRRRGPSQFSIKVKIPQVNSRDLLQVDMRMEFHSFSSPRRMGRKTYQAEIVPKDRRISNDILAMQEMVVEKTFVDMSFNMTNVLLSSLEHGRDWVNVRLHLQRNSRSAKEVGQAAVKAFLIIHEADHTCSQNTVNITAQITNSILLSKKSPLGLVRTNSDMNWGQCSLKKWKVMTSDINWQDFVVYPHEINANRCSGLCSYPVRDIDITDHAFLKLSAHIIKLGDEPQLPCCVPKSLAPISMILVDPKTKGFVFCSRPNLVAKSCACL